MIINLITRHTYFNILLEFEIYVFFGAVAKFISSYSMFAMLNNLLL